MSQKDLISTLPADVVLKVEHLGKKFCRTLKRSMYYGVLDMSRSMLGIIYDTSQLRKHEFWALDNINFELKKGETLGIIGENGSGKSTLLRLITGIFPPDVGKISFRGRIGALIAVGAGFHPHMTGRENIYLNGTILGMSKKEIDAKYDEIVDFADIGEFLEAPVNTYSSGMRVRLGFAIAVHCEPDILLIDEVLSVGDLSFRNKSLRKMAELREKAKALIFISHNLEQVRNLCSRVIVMDKGKIVFEGDATDGILFYENLSRKIRLEGLDKKNIVEGMMDSSLELLKTGITDLNEKEITNVDCNESFIHFFDFKAKKDSNNLFFSSGILDESNKVVIWVINNDEKKSNPSIKKNNIYRVKFIYYKHNLMPGVYSLSHGIRNQKTFETHHRITKSGSFIVNSKNKQERGLIQVDYDWSIEKKDK